MEEKRYLTITALTKYLKMKFERDTHLQQVYLKGEISNFKAHSRGHFYFTLKDPNTRISAVMFSNSNKHLNFLPKDGMKVLVCGRVDLYETTGSYQIYVDELVEDGVGNLFVEFEKLKQKLQDEGLFDQQYKKPIPKIPKKIGIVTAPTGAAIRDILTTIKRRFPIAETLLFPALVQGEYAKQSIADAINKAQNYDIDVLIVGRGGGSIEDLWAFNEEIVARAIFASKIPIISAVGHEVDVTISDFVSDLRAATPTGAAEIAVPNLLDVIQYIDGLEIRMKQAMIKNISFKRERLNTFANSYILKNPLKLYEQKEQQLDHLVEKLQSSIKYTLKNRRERLDQLSHSYVLENPKFIYENKYALVSSLEEKLVNTMTHTIIRKQASFEGLVHKLDALSPLKILGRGFSMVRNEKDESVTSVSQITNDQLLQLILKDGKVTTKVVEIEED